MAANQIDILKVYYQYKISCLSICPDPLYQIVPRSILTKFWVNMMKILKENEVSQFRQGSLWEGPGTFRASKNIKGTKHPLGGVRKDVQKLTENLII